MSYPFQQSLFLGGYMMCLPGYRSWSRHLCSKEVFPFIRVQNTSHTLLPFKVVGILASTLYALIPLVTNQTRLRRILEKIEGFEKAKSWLLELGPRFKDSPLEDLVNELLLGVRKFSATGINLLLVIGREAQSEKR